MHRKKTGLRQNSRRDSEDEATLSGYVQNSDNTPYLQYIAAVTWSDDVVMEDEDLGDGFFLYMYEIEDMFGTEYDTDPVEMQVGGDTIIPYES